MKGPKDKVKLSEQGVVTEEALIAYLHNELSPEEKQQLEKLLSEDPFAQDALEGLQAADNKTAVTTSLSSLNKKVRERSGLKERKGLNVHWVTYAWAAVLLGLLIGIGFIMVNFLNKDNHNDIAQNKNAPAPVMSAPGGAPAKDTLATTAAVSADTLKSAPVSGKDSVKTTVVANGSNTAYNFTTTTTTKPIAATNEIKSNVNTATVTYSDRVKTSDKTALEKSKSSESNARKSLRDSVAVAGSTGTYEVSTHNDFNQVVKKEGKPEIKDFATLQDEAMKSFNAGDYVTAGEYFDKIVKHDPENADALYFGGISDYLTGKTAKSESNFDHLLKKGNKYTEGTKWYKANILIKKGKSDAAKALLQDLSNGSSSYKERAIKKLAEMGF